MKNKNHIQQGDVLISLIDKLPTDAKLLPKDKRGCVLAEGELTGHYHACKDEGVLLYERPNGARFVHNTTSAPRRFTHQEHKSVTVPSGGIASLGIVREKDWFKDMVRPVVD